MDLEEKLEEFIERMEDEEKSEATIKKYKANINSFIEYTKDKKNKPTSNPSTSEDTLLSLIHISEPTRPY